ncbi:NAD(P)/FAD-dependent oxidoreductase [Acidiferrimicrobium sp. IK]|uniref:dihydrolipoyl dehydrogenase family protein n=1 Tax=Acidiferrimicrobium sp. IK TaxID=2871700 RepID=UPI0021CB8615|nr:NAD(P)/FAD-dependent oxidoreductase [Acidiferrimicrobium sp. IK]MCU4183021.1 NAD(P)/FAD-dependent oxidoreductase [Acidiferrimicrobium sp. IK]
MADARPDPAGTDPGPPAPPATDTWDVIVVGGGPPGENVAQYAIQGSDRTAVIVEAELVGGECSYWACMPSKALLRPVEILDTARSMPGVAGAVTGAIDVGAVLERRDSFTHHRDDSSQVQWARGAGIDVVRGRGRLAGEKAVAVTAADGTTRTIRARHAVVLSTGTTASVPPVPGLADAQPWTSRDVTNLAEIPRRVAVIGGGVVACEAATWLRGLGAEEVTIIEPAPALLAKLEPFAGEILAERFESQGITVRTATPVERVERPVVAATGVGRIHGGPAAVTAGGTTIEVDEIVVAAGRTPASKDIGLDTVGVNVGAAHGFVPVNDHLGVEGVDGEWLYAVGDVNGRALLTHMGKYQSRIAGDVIAARADGRPLDGSRYRDVADHDMVPSVVFTDPQVASVGLTESAARDKGANVEVLEYDLGAVAGASLARDGYKGRAKLIVDRDTETLLGATFVGSDVAELLHSATTAIVGKVTLDTLWHVVPSYPTISEVWLRLLESRR